MSRFSVSQLFQENRAYGDPIGNAKPDGICVGRPNQLRVCLIWRRFDDEDAVHKAFLPQL